MGAHWSGSTKAWPLNAHNLASTRTIYTQLLTSCASQGSLVPGTAVDAPGATVVAPVTDTHAHKQGIRVLKYTNFKAKFQNIMRMIHHNAHIISNDKKIHKEVCNIERICG